MTEPASKRPADDSAFRLPRHTTPTWEVELLISGVAVFAMLQLPAWLDDQAFAMKPRFDELWGDPLLVLYGYLKCTALILSATFSAHLLLRAQWIAMVGMHSVYPGGIRWDKLRMGPVQREIESRRYGTPAATIERADNRATVVFSIGVMLASMFLQISLLVLGLFAITLPVAMLAGAKADINIVLIGCFAIAMLPMFLARLLDRHRGNLLRKDGLARRMLAAVLGLYMRLGLTQKGSNPVFSLLASHDGERRTVALTTVVMFAAGLAVTISLVSQSHPRSLGNYALFPAFSDGSRTLDSMHYADQRNPARDPAVPFIASLVATGPYLRLVVPYQPRRDASALRDACPLAASTADDARAAAALDCLQHLHAVLLDGRPLPALQYELGDDARTDRPALVAMIDVRALAKGRHELWIARGAPAAGTHEAVAPWRIPFWR